MTYYYYEGKSVKEHICPNCGGMMEEDKIVMGIQIYRCPFCGEWGEE